MPKFEVGVWKYVTITAPDPDVASAIALATLPGEGWQAVDEPRIVPADVIRLDDYRTQPAH